MSNFQTETMPVAPKQHKCCECYDPIQPGQQYQFITGCWDCDMATCKTCTSCLAPRTWATPQPEWGSYGEHLYYFGQLEEDLSFLVPEIPSQNGRRFHAYRLQVLMSRRRLAAQAQRNAA